jgi:hypothetical protein
MSQGVFVTLIPSSLDHLQLMLGFALLDKGLLLIIDKREHGIKLNDTNLSPLLIYPKIN